MKNPFGTQRWYASTLHKQIIVTKAGKKVKSLVHFSGDQQRLYAYYSKQAHTVKQIGDGIWEEID